MDEHLPGPVAPRPFAVPMRARSPQQQHRASTPLELLFDLVFVVAVSQTSAALHHALAEGHMGEGVSHFLVVFFAIWWAWINFSWFASAYDTDDVLYRITTFVQLFGALILAAGVSRGFNLGDFTIMVSGYVVMRLALVLQWLRAAKSDPEHRATALRYAAGITILQVLWVIRLFLPATWQTPTLIVLILAEFAIPPWSERTGATTWHPGHIAERYGLFTIIVLGESILSASMAIQSALDSGSFNSTLAEIIIGGMLIVLSMWWLYFDRSAEDLLTSQLIVMIWGFGHFFLFGAAAAVGAGIALQVDYATHHTEISAVAAGTAIAFPVAIYVISLLLMHLRPGELSKGILPSLVAASLIALTPFSGHAALLGGILLVTLVVVKHVIHWRLSAIATQVQP